jgi:hypothetical protein
MKRFVKFNSDGFVNGELVFKKDETYAFETNTSADRWIARGNTEVSEKAPAKKETAPPPPPPPKTPVAPPKEDKKKVVDEDEDGL